MGVLGQRLFTLGRWCLGGSSRLSVSAERSRRIARAMRSGVGAHARSPALGALLRGKREPAMPFGRHRFGAEKVHQTNA